MTHKEVYRIEGLSCTNCAAKFQHNVEQIEGVESVNLNFGAAKLEVTGDVTLEALEAAGKFDNIKVRPAHMKAVHHDPFYKRKENIPFFIACVLFIVSIMSGKYIGDAHIITIILFIMSMIVGGYRLFIEGMKGLIKLKFDMNVLMTIAVIGAALIGELQEGAMVVILFAISEMLETYAMDKSRAGIASLIDIAPDTALVMKGDTFIEVDVIDITPGSIVRVLPGKKVPVDGMVIEGQSTINEASITGESMPVSKHTEDRVYAGTLNITGQLLVRVTAHSNDTKLAQMIHLVEEAQSKKAPAQQFVDRFAKYYTPFIMAIALCVIIIPPMFGGDFKHYLYQGLSILVVGCPCALVISTPVAIVTAIGRAAKEGVLIKGGVHLENAGHINTIAFDKTGTLTKGEPVVVLREDFETQRDAYIYALESDSGHPLSCAITVGLSEDSKVEVDNYEVIAGMGVKGIINGTEYRIGKQEFFQLSRETITRIDELYVSGSTVVIFGEYDKAYTVFFIKDTVRDEAASVIQQLKRMNIKTLMLTGDNENVGTSIGEEVGVSTVHAGLLPEDKLNLIQQYQQNRKVAMIGDGVNDAPALAQADVGFSMGGAATDTALETADIALMKDNLGDLPKVIDLSRRTMKVIKQNIAFALGLKLLAILLVIPGWLTLWIAIFADMGATLLVTLNSLRLMKKY
ncbi:heavy metal translocating P-type ATPase [Macrococcus armenti]|uniref:heavy metal translocating P-type ATPase n=1 Tax=Macrococcus armenti TaxID=2875764 RepID=UPI001CCCA026|nr:heavy metal translocating P-type ATPase [Macrococcus armenti]UBH12808.1 cadmium-translocating P-type ATPase [Macrococcus armenti]